MRALVLSLACVVGCGSTNDTEETTTIEDAGVETARDLGTTESDTGSVPAPPSCTNGTRDGDETDVDCGGPCGKCGTGATCLGAGDCKSGSCVDATCSCVVLDDCPSGQSCVAGACVPAAATCAATKTANPAAKDGEYWIKPATGAAYRAYCDMLAKAEICNEAGTAVTGGKTRDGSARAWTGKAKLVHATGLCELWALAGPSNYPFDRLNAVLGQTLTTCQALGFVADGTLGSCPYGSGTGKTNCGFTVTTLYRYGNVCTSGCTVGAGSSKTWVQQGPMVSASVLTNAGGTIKTTCKVR